MAWLARVGGTSVFFFISAFLNGWVISSLWDWFIIPLGAPHMPITSAIGLSIICQALIGQDQKESSEKYKDCENFTELVTVAFVEIFTSRIVTLFIGWIVTLFQ